ncbi:MAG TPA: hypothetical protein VJ417_03620, partial [Candidatus Glassbacteria bacterium]|nr:hypothetical protein [Candidatus Glassbacteria bacterium]
CLPGLSIDAGRMPAGEGEGTVMETFAILGFVFGIFGLIAFARVNRLHKQVYLLRSDLQHNHDHEHGACGCDHGEEH